MENADFKVGTKVVYPSHGVGIVMGIETQKIGEHEIHFYNIEFTEQKILMTLKIPVNKATKSGLRSIVSLEEFENIVYNIFKKALKTKKSIMWNRRAAEYQLKINSGDISSLAEVLKELSSEIDDTEKSYSERIIYDSALQRLSSELSNILNIDKIEAIKIIEEHLHAEKKVLAN